jgi:hypothetical protein
MSRRSSSDRDSREIGRGSSSFPVYDLDSSRRHTSLPIERQSSSRSPLTHRYSGPSGHHSPFSSGISPLSAPRDLQQRHNDAFDRLDHDASRLDWLHRNGYGPQAFGIGLGLNSRYGRYGATGVLSRYDSGRRCPGVRVRIGLQRCYRERPVWRRWCYRPSWCGSSWYDRYPSCASSFYYPALWPAYFGSTTYVYEYPTYVKSQYPIESYYGDGGYYADGSNFAGTQLVEPDETIAPVENTHVDQAIAAFQRGEFDLARRELIRAMIAYPDDPELLMLYGYAHFATGDYLVASLAIRRALNADPTLIDSPVDIYRLYPDADVLRKQIDALDEHLAEKPNDGDAQFLAGFVRYAAGLPDQAADIFAARVQQAPDDVLALLMRDAAIRGSALQRAAAPEAETEPTPESQPNAPAENVPEPGSS